MKSQTTNSSDLQLLRGQSGRAIAEPINDDLLLGFHQHLTMERASSAQYYANSIWFLEREYRGFASFYKSESTSEQEHAIKFSDYLVGRGYSVSLDALDQPKQNWDSIEELITFSFQMEADVTTSLNQLYALAERSSDVRSTVFLDPIVEGQTNSEDEFAYLLGKVRLSQNQPSALFILDAEFLQAK